MLFTVSPPLGNVWTPTPVVPPFWPTCIIQLPHYTLMFRHEQTVTTGVSGNNTVCCCRYNVSNGLQARKSWPNAHDNMATRKRLLVNYTLWVTYNCWGEAWCSRTFGHDLRARSPFDTLQRQQQTVLLPLTSVVTVCSCRTWVYSTRSVWHMLARTGAPLV
jgi:hypothetical protein